MKTIAIGKIGKSIQFKRSRWGTATGGQMEPPLFYSTIANLNPQNTYVLVGKSDFSKLSDEERKDWFKYDNVIDLWDGFSFKNYEGNVEEYPLKVLREKNITVDYGLFYSGGGALGCTLHNKLLTRKGDRFAKPLQSSNYYAGPIVHFLNETKIPWISLAPDDRFVPMKINDLLNPEKYVLGLVNKTCKVERVKDFDNLDVLVEHEVKSIYSGIETVFLLNNKLNEPEEKTEKFVIFHNQAGDINKVPIIKEYFFDNDLEVKIYGTWKDEVYASNDSYKGPLRFEDLQELLPKVKYTFMIPNSNDVRSMKFWEAIHNGIIPFMYEEYDTSKIYNKLGLPNFIRVYSPEELKEKVEFLEENPGHYEALIDNLRKMLKPGYYNGEYINNEVNKAAKIIGVE